MTICGWEMWSHFAAKKFLDGWGGWVVKEIFVMLQFYDVFGIDIGLLRMK